MNYIIKILPCDTRLERHHFNFFRHQFLLNFRPSLEAKFWYMKSVILKNKIAPAAQMLSKKISFDLIWVLKTKIASDKENLKWWWNPQMMTKIPNNDKTRKWWRKPQMMIDENSKWWRKSKMMLKNPNDYENPKWWWKSWMMTKT